MCLIRRIFKKNKINRSFATLIAAFVSALPALIGFTEKEQ
jgi:hypothetical protein